MDGDDALGAFGYQVEENVTISDFKVGACELIDSSTLEVSVGLRVTIPGVDRPIMLVMEAAGADWLAGQLSYFAGVARAKGLPQADPDTP